MWSYFEEPPERAENQVWRSVAQLFIAQTEDFNPETQFVNVRNDEHRAFCTKPMYQTGLWTSTYLPDWNYPSEWVEWCIGEEFGSPYTDTWWLLYPRKDARVFVTETQRDLKYLMRTYPYQLAAYPANLLPAFTMIDFEAMTVITIQYNDGKMVTRTGTSGLTATATRTGGHVEVLMEFDFTTREECAALVVTLLAQIDDLYGENMVAQCFSHYALDTNKKIVQQPGKRDEYRIRGYKDGRR